MGKRNKNREPLRTTVLGRDWVRLDLVAGPPDARVVIDSQNTRYREMDHVVRRWGNKYQVLTVKTAGKSDERKIMFKGETLDDVRYLYTVLDITKPPTDDPNWELTTYDGWVRKYNNTSDIHSMWDMHEWETSVRTPEPPLGPPPAVIQTTEPVLP